MSTFDTVGALLALVVGVYLLVTLLRAEEF